MSGTTALDPGTARFHHPNETSDGVQYSPAWFAVFTMPRHEKRVAEYFEHGELESFLPLYKETRRWRNRTNVTVELPLFPCYIFTRIERQQRVRVLNIPGVVEVLGCAGENSPVPDECIDFLKRGVQLGKLLPHPNVTVGDRVRITGGPMVGMEGHLTRIKNEVRVVLRLDFILRSVALEVNIDEVELISVPA